MMGEIARTVLAGGGRAVGVIPKALRRKEIAYEDLTELHVVDDPKPPAEGKALEEEPAAEAPEPPAAAKP